MSYTVMLFIIHQTNQIFTCCLCFTKHYLKRVKKFLMFYYNAKQILFNRGALKCDSVHLKIKKPHIAQQQEFNIGGSFVNHSPG